MNFIESHCSFDGHIKPPCAHKPSLLFVTAYPFAKQITLSMRIKAFAILIFSLGIAYPICRFILSRRKINDYQSKIEEVRHPVLSSSPPFSLGDQEASKKKTIGGVQ